MRGFPPSPPTHTRAIALAGAGKNTAMRNVRAKKNILMFFIKNLLTSCPKNEMLFLSDKEMTMNENMIDEVGCEELDPAAYAGTCPTEQEMIEMAASFGEG